MRFLRLISKTPRKLLAFCKTLVKKLILYYITFSYLKNFIPLQIILSRFPGNSGFRFETKRTSEHPKLEFLKIKILDKESTVSIFDKVQSKPKRLVNTRVLIIKSSKAQYKYHLNSMSSNLEMMLTDLGSIVRIESILGMGEGPQFTNGFIPEIIVVDNEIYYSDFLRVEKFVKKLGRGQKRPKLVMICYDLWRKGDIDFVTQVASKVDAFLAMDPVVTQKFITPEIRKKFYDWPVTKYWADAKDAIISGAQENSIYFSGNVRGIDRREILNQLLVLLRGTKIGTKFHVFDPMIPRSVPTKDNYLKEINTNLAVLSLNQKLENHWIITARTWEVLISPRGGVLIQQEGLQCKPLSTILSPFEDYLPFSCPGSLVDVLDFCLNNTTFLNDISSRGRNKTLHYFSDDVLCSPFV